MFACSFRTRFEVEPPARNTPPSSPGRLLPQLLPKSYDLPWSSRSTTVASSTHDDRDRPSRLASTFPPPSLLLYSIRPRST